MSQSSTFKYTESIAKLEQLWLDYNELIPAHNKLVEIKKELKMPIEAKARTFLRDEYPDIDFLKITCLKEAVDYIYDLKPRQIDSLIKQIEKEKIQGVFYSSMTKWIRDSIAAIKRYGTPSGYLYHDSPKYREKNKRAKELLKQVNYRET